MSKISIILPVYNSEKYLVRCIKSIMEQSMDEAGDIQVIAVNNGSKDRSINILKLYKDKIKDFKIIDKVNGNNASAKIIGLGLAEGEYVSLVDPRDTLEKDFCKKMYLKAKEENADIVFSDACILNFEKAQILNGITESKKIDVSCITDYTFINNVILKKEYINKHNICFKNYSYYEDLAFMLDVITEGPKISYINEVLYNSFEKVDMVINKKNLVKKADELFDILTVNKEDSIEKQNIVEYATIDLLLNNNAEKFIQIPSIKVNLIKKFKEEYVGFKKNKYLKTKTFKYKYNIIKTYKKIVK